MVSSFKFKVFIITTTIFLLTAFSCKSFESSYSNHNTNYKDTDLVVHFIDVGQGDSILVQINNKNLLIDGGPNTSATKVNNYLSKQNVKKLDYIVATHPHEDHIGGLSDVIKKFEIGIFYSPKITTNADTFENMIKSLRNKKQKITIAKQGEFLELGNPIKAEILSPTLDKYDDLNNYSVIIKLSYNKLNFLFMGDAEKLIENNLIKNNINLQSDIIKIAHHGSNSSSSAEFLNIVSPTYAIISCGKNNEYGHPHKDIINELNRRHLNIYRTDRNGDIVFIFDGNNLKIKSSK
jgi:competence protein ComEC